MKKYQPSNGTEGMIFTEKYCMNCINCDPDPSGEKQCQILLATLIHNINDKEYPKEWVYNENSKPTCTSWVKWDWGNDGDPDDPENPNSPPVYDPDQLVLFSVADETLNNHKPTSRKTRVVQN